MLRLGKTSIYGLFAVIHVAKTEPQKPVQGRDIAEAYGLPVEYLLKILQLLARGGVLKSARGRSGGFTLNRSAQEISLRDIIDVLESPFDFTQVLEQSVPGHEPIKLFLTNFEESLQSTLRDTLHGISVQRLVEMDNCCERAR